MNKTLEFEIGAMPPARLDKALARDVPEAAALSRTRLTRLIEEGAVRVSGTIAQGTKQRVCAGDQIEITLRAALDSHIESETMPLDIIFEDDELLVVNKPAGLVVHPAPGTPSGTLVNGLLAHCGAALSGVGGIKRPGIVHRIDKDTSGLLVVAKTDAAHHGLAAQFAAHTVERAYEAFVYGRPDPGDPRLRGVRGLSFEPGGVIKMTSQIARHRTDRQRQAVVFSGGKHAVTRLRVQDNFAGTAARLICWLETGRTHQIRVHMAHIGHGLIGDPVYGGARKMARGQMNADAASVVGDFARQALHAACLGFVHPTRRESLRFDSPLPIDMENLKTALDSTLC